MIIICINCTKKFEVDSDLIPISGRLVQCNGCNHKWFFKKTIINENISFIKSDKTTDVTKVFDDQLDSTKIEKSENIETLDTQVKKYQTEEKKLINKINDNKSYSKNKKNYNLLGLTVVFLLSFIAIIVVIDTFQQPISKIFPNIEFILYNLYETINDIGLFLKDLI